MSHQLCQISSNLISGMMDISLTDCQIWPGCYSGVTGQVSITLSGGDPRYCTEGVDSSGTQFYSVYVKILAFSLKMLAKHLGL